MAVGSNWGYLSPDAFRRRGGLTFLIRKRVKIPAQKKEVEGNEEDDEAGRGSIGIIGFFFWMCGDLQGKQIEMSKVWSGFHSR